MNSNNGNTTPAQRVCELPAWLQEGGAALWKGERVRVGRISGEWVWIKKPHESPRSRRRMYWVKAYRLRPVG